MTIEAIGAAIGAIVIAGYVVGAAFIVIYGLRALDGRRESIDRMTCVLIAILFAVMLK